MGAGDVKAFLHTCRQRAEKAVADSDVASSTEESMRVQPCAWSCDGTAWCVDAPKALLRKDEVFKPLHQFLIRHTARGTINRQEEVSMLPPIMLDIGAGHRCLDMCAAPGSKTAQMLVALAAANFQRWGRGLDDICDERVRRCRSSLRGRIDYSKDEGLVVANDLSSDRSGMLVHQVARHRLLYPLAAFTSHDARFFPSVRTPCGEELRFDRILCDVMCSGDGTLRKEPHMWRRWDAKAGLELHRDQLGIALRAARLLKVGGRMVYSTCSMSPVEDEAVVGELLRCARGSLAIVDMRGAVAPFRFCRGLRTWQVAHPGTNQLHGTYAEAVAAGGAHKHLVPGHFPPAEGSAPSEALSHCMRILPHHNDTGGFFIAVFDKVAELERGGPRDDEGVTAAAGPPQGEDPQPQPYDSDNDEDAEEEERRRQLGRLEQAIAGARSEQERAKATAKRDRMRKSGMLSPQIMRFVRAADAMPHAQAQMREFYGLLEGHASGDDFPSQQLFCRYHLELDDDGNEVQTHDGDGNQLVFCARGVADFVLSATGPHAKRKLRIVTGGLRCFVKDRFELPAKSSSYRIAQESVELLLPYFRRRVVALDDPADTRLLLSSAEKGAAVKNLSSSEQPALDALGPGGCTLLLRTGSGDYVPVSALRTKHAVNVYVDDNDMACMREACGIEQGEDDEPPRAGRQAGCDADEGRGEEPSGANMKEGGGADEGKDEAPSGASMEEFYGVEGGNGERPSGAAGRSREHCTVPCAVI